MRCEFRDGLKINYAGSLGVRKGTEINAYKVADDSMPDFIRAELDKAVRNGSCSEMRKIAEAIIRNPCGRICLNK